MPPEIAVQRSTDVGQVSSVRSFERLDYLVFALVTLLFWAAAAYLLTLWFSFGGFSSSPFIFLGLTAILVTRIALNQLRWWSLPFMKRPVAMPPSAGWRVGVATTFVPGVEPIRMLEDTVAALIAMDYPHDTWVLDEGDDPAVKELCRRVGAHYFSRRSLPQYNTTEGKFKARTKYGNYNSWFAEVAFERYDFIATFDPDHVPQGNFLTSTLGYFGDSGVGYVQAPQIYYNQRASFIARGAAEETYNYYSSIQMSFYGLGYPIVVGCHNLHRMPALREVGGFPQHDADDLMLTLKYRSSGWRGVYVPEVLARGLTPVDWDGYLRQQVRWARSVLDVKLRVYPRLAGSLSIREKVTALFHGFYYLQGLTTLIVLLLLVAMLVTGSVPAVVNYMSLTGSIILSVAGMLCELYRQRFYIERSREWGLHWRAGLLQVAKWPYLVQALHEVITRREKPYSITRKTAAGRRSFTWMLPHIATAAVVAAAWVYALYSGFDLHPLVHAAVVVIVVSTVVLTLTCFIRFPDPFMPIGKADNGRS